MKGKNQIELFKKAADEIVELLSKNEAVIGIMYSEGLARGFADKYSDVDILVFMSSENSAVRKSAKLISADIEHRDAIETDIEVHVLDAFMKQQWDDYLKWDLSNSKVVFDRDGVSSKKIGEKLKVDEEFTKTQIAKNMVYISWYCFPEKSGIPSMIDLWDNRGDPASAHHAVSYAMDLTTEILYALNKSYIPAPKWRIHYLQNLDLVSMDFQSIFEKAILVREMSVTDARKRASTLHPLWREMLVLIQATKGLDYEQAKKYYIEKTLHLLVE
jgi:predicted nucleotidyltransferase